MSDFNTGEKTRREFLRDASIITAGSAMAMASIPAVFGAEDNTIRLALVGCGGRGSGAVGDALGINQGPVKLVAMADVFPDRLKGSYQALKDGFGAKIEVPEDQKFIGFDAYKKAIDCLRPGDIVIFATPPAFRWVHFTYAIEKGVNVFMEKPISVDGPSTRRMLKLGEEAMKKNLKVGVGLMCRHCETRKQLIDKLQAGLAGDILAMRAYRMHEPLGYFASPPKPEGISELMYQVQRFHSFLWAGGGNYSDFYIHHIDECCWIKGGWPVSAEGLGGRHYRGDSIDQNLDTYSVEYTFADGAKLILDGRCMVGCKSAFASYAHGTKGLIVISEGGHSPAHSRIYKGQNMRDDAIAWKFEGNEKNPYSLEWDDLFKAVRQNKTYNEVKRGAEASLVTAMGRMAAHCGQTVTFDQALNYDFELGKDLDKLTMTSAAPLLAGPDGKYPVPMPGMTKNLREF